MSDGTSRFSGPRRSDRRNRKRKPPLRADIFRTQYYFTKGHEHLGEAINVTEEQSPFLYPPCSLMFSYFQYWKAKKRTMGEEQRRDPAMLKTAHELLRKLRVDVEIEALEAKKHKDPDEMIAITDVDPEYFTELTGRPVKEKFSLREYIEDSREIFRTRLLAGQELDDCIRIEQQFVLEQKKLDEIKHRYRQYVSGFEEFLSKDHEESMKILLHADEEVRRTREISDERNRLAKEFGQVRLEVYNWEENWRTVKMCQRFLYQVAPITWREEFDWIHRTSSGENIASASTEDLFGRYKMAEEAGSLDTLIELFEHDIAEAGPTDLYFQEPFELIQVFRTIETQNLNALIHLESLAQPMTDMLATIESAEEHIKTRVTELTNEINEVQNAISKYETRAADLEMYANTLLEGVFRDAVCSDEVLRFQVFIENAYESCIGPNDANLDSFSMMKWIEKTHEELNLELDTLPPEVVQACEQEGFKQELKAMKETEEAAKKYELMYRLLAAMKRIMEPPVTKGRPLTWRSRPTVQKVKAKPPPPVPTDEEMQYLTFFTKYCPQEDFTEYRSQFPDDFDLSFQPRRRPVQSESEVSENEEKVSSEASEEDEANDEQE
ncbi:cilia- and flagella-associated protein 100 [Calliopsis andreniformis]|uniref:cilia- and flagella-associated protein 100 n=1 Tax=Calliopsis andreniformis TaxID=337506 RepID=UPI003FCC7C2A